MRGPAPLRFGDAAVRRWLRSWFKKPRKSTLPLCLSDDMAESIRKVVFKPYHLPLFSIAAVDEALRTAYSLGAADQRARCECHDD